MDIDTTPPAAHRDNMPTMQLDIPPQDEVMMEVDATDFSVISSPPIPSRDSVPPSASPPATFHTSPPSTSTPDPPPHTPARFLPTPPVALITTSDVPPWPKLKLDQLFVEWLARPESKRWLTGVLDDARRADPPPSPPVASVPAPTDTPVPTPSTASPPSPARTTVVATPTSSPAPPGSPVSRLFRTHLPFADSDSSPRSPPPSVPSASPLRTAISAPAIASDIDLGKSGSISPLSTDHPIVSDPPISTDASPIDLPAVRDDPDKTPDHTALDRVADGIAGMTAHVDPPVAALLPSTSVPASTSDPALATPGPSATSGPVLQPTSEQATVTPSPTEQAAETSVETPIDMNATAASPVDDAKPVQDSKILSASVDVDGEEKEASATSQAGQTPNQTGDKLMADASGASKPDAERIIVTSAHPPPSPRPTVLEDGRSSAPRPKRKSLPRFYFPCGRDAESRERKECEAIKEFFRIQRTQKNAPGVSRSDIAELVVEVVGLPSYFASIIYTIVSEQFPRRNADQPATTNESDMTPPLSGVQAQNEEVMRDVNEQPGSTTTAQGQAMDSAMRTNAQEDTGATNSDTTMGDATEANGQEQRANGFHGANSRPAGTEVVQDPTGVGDSSVSVAADGSRDFITEEQMVRFYKERCAGCSKEARLFHALRERDATRSYLVPSDFKPLLRALLMCHQGLAFLHATPEFQQRYSETVIERIYFGCTQQHNGRLALQDIKRSKLLDTLMIVDEEEDINRERRYFSYEHFYVLYCRFWELDANHDLQIDREDLMRYGSHSLTNKIVDRIFGGFARPLDQPDNPGYMSYTDFIWFCLSEEDKTSDTAIDYWFRCVDRDGDGLITMYDMEFFYKEQLQRMESFGHEPVQVKDILCQLLDMIKPKMHPPVIRRRDLKRSRLAGNFFNVLFNLNKFFAIEARDPLQIRQEHATPELTDWDRFAALEYLRLSAEEEGEEDEAWEDVGEAANPLMAGEAPF